MCVCWVGLLEDRKFIRRVIDTVGRWPHRGSEEEEANSGAPGSLIVLRKTLRFSSRLQGRCVRTVLL